jgi:hypothetical protein
MAVQEVRASGLAYLTRATELLQRARLAHEEGGLWEAADLQWWWRMPRRSDSIDYVFWFDDDGPSAGVTLTDWGRTWGRDPIVVPTRAAPPLPRVWSRALDAIDALGLETVETLVHDDDTTLRGLLAASGFVASGDRSGIAWMSAEDLPEVAPLPDGCVLVDRREDVTRPHPMEREAARRSRPASGNAPSTIPSSTCASRPLTVRSPATPSSGSTR